VTSVLPSLFISHGAPDLLLSDEPAARFLRGFAAMLPRPRAIVVASAHWTTPEVEIEAGARPETIHDFGGFARELNARRYPAPGEPALAADIAARLQAAGLTATARQRGFDHGVWVPLSLLYPGASIPVVALSVQPERDGAHHLAVGAALASLRADGVLVIGSGAATHDLSSLAWDGGAAPGWVMDFDDWLVARAEAGDAEALADWEQRGPQARRNHPSPEHLLPLLVAMGAGGGTAGRAVHRSTTYGVLRMTMLSFTGG